MLAIYYKEHNVNRLNNSYEHNALTHDSKWGHGFLDGTTGRVPQGLLVTRML